MKYNIADLIVEFEPRFEMLSSRAKKYLVKTDKKRDFHIYVTDEQIKQEKMRNSNLSDELAEYMLMGGSFYEFITYFKGCFLHASAVVIDNEAYLFSAPCGTGKSTHTSLWLKYLKSQNPYILNDDKPAIRILEDGIYAYGTPFSGKYDINVNKKAKLKAICFIEQSKINRIRTVKSKEAIQLFFDQTFKYLNKEEMTNFLDTLDTIIKKVPIYKLYCDMSKEAVQLSYQTMKGEV